MSVLAFRYDLDPSTTPARLLVHECGPEDRAAWNAFVARSPGAVSYHRWEWGEVICEEMNLPRVYLAVQLGDSIRGILPLIEQTVPFGPRFLTSLPFVNYAGLLARSGEASIVLLAGLERVLRERGYAYAELRSVPGTRLRLPASRRKVRPVLHLPDDPQVQWKRFTSKLRAQVRRPGREGMTAVHGGEELLDEFYEVVSAKWREHGSPVYRRSFFSRILATFPGENVIHVVRAGDQAVAVGWLHSFGGSTEIVWAASRREFDRFSPNMLLYWSAIEQAIERGQRQFDFGRSTAGTGTHRFKMQWGPEVDQLPWHYVMGQTSDVPAAVDHGWRGQAFKALWRNLPLGMTRLLGPKIARRLPL